MTGEVFVMIPKTDLDRLLTLSNRVEELMKSQQQAAKDKYSATMTIAEIKELTNISRYKWLQGVKSGIYPQPLEGFENPKRWATAEVRKAVNPTNA